MSNSINEVTVVYTPNRVDVSVDTNGVVLTSPGPQGIPGPIGPPGGATFEFIQASPSISWVINHGLNRYPPVLVFVDPVGYVQADIVYGTLNQLTVQFLAPQSGKAELG